MSESGKTAPTNRLRLALLVAFTAFAGPLLFIEMPQLFDDLDERLFHLPAIEQFALQLPTPDLIDYPSATTPLYHLVLSLIAAPFAHNVSVLRVVNLLISLGALAVAWQTLARWGTGKSATVMAAMLACSPYFIGPATRLSTDNAALLAVFAAIGLMEPKQDRPRAAGWVTTAAILTRQLHVWLIGLMLLRGLHVPAERKRWLMSAAIPLISIAGFVVAWGALTPPSFSRGHAAGLNVDTLVFKLTIFGLYGLFVLPWFAPVAAKHKRAIGASVSAALVLLCIIHLPYQDNPNRWGGAIWQLAARTPAFLDVPTSFWVLAPLGAGIVATLAFCGPRGRYLFVCVCLWSLAGLASARAYQKYSDPLILFVLGLAVQQLPRPPQWAWLGPAALIAGLLLVDVMRFYVG